MNTNAPVDFKADARDAGREVCAVSGCSTGTAVNFAMVRGWRR